MTPYIIKYFFIIEIKPYLNEQGRSGCDGNRNIDVIIVESVDKGYTNNKKEILVKPESNPYYEKEHYEEHETIQTISLENSIDKIKAINNIYYE